MAGDPEPPVPPDPPADDGAGPHAPRLRYQGVFDFAPDPQLVTDAAGVVVAANHAAADLLRCPKEFLAGKPLGLFAAPGQRTRLYSALSQLNWGATGVSFETAVTRRGEEPRDVAVTVVPDDRPVVSGGRTGHLHWRLFDVTARKRAEAERDDLLRRLVTAQEDERRRVARDLHDSVGQLLTGLSLAAKAALAGPVPPAAAGKLADVLRLSDAIGKELHALAVRLRPTALDDLGLDAALGQLVREWAARTGVPADSQVTGLGGGRLPPEVETTVYRVVQEALTNVARHARATQVSMAVTRYADGVTAVVEDDGVGFAPSAAGAGRLGLVGMRERLALVGGTLEVESAPGAGTTVLARVPLGGR